MADYDEVLDRQAELMRFWSSAQGDRILRVAAKVDEGEITRERHQEAMIATLEGDPYYVEKPVCALIAAATPSIPLNWAFEEKHIFSETGFVWFANPIENNYSDQPCSICGFGWVKLKSATKVYVNVVSWAKTNMISIVHPLTSHLINLVGGTSLEAVARDMERQEDALPGEAPYAGTRTGELKLFASFLLFIEQQIIVRSPRAWSRATGRRLAQTNPDLLKEVNVITLRRQRYSDDSDNHVDVDWQVQWAVRGHWRQQYHPSTQNRVPCWINPYIKGPPDKPMKNADHLFDVRR